MQNYFPHQIFFYLACRTFDRLLLFLLFLFWSFWEYKVKFHTKGFRWKSTKFFVHQSFFNSFKTKKSLWTELSFHFALVTCAGWGVVSEMGLVRISSWYPNFNGSHFGLPPSEIHRMTGLPPKFVWGMTYSHRPHSRQPNCPKRTSFCPCFHFFRSYS